MDCKLKTNLDLCAYLAVLLPVTLLQKFELVKRLAADLLFEPDLRFCRGSFALLLLKSRPIDRSNCHHCSSWCSTGWATRSNVRCTKVRFPSVGWGCCALCSRPLRWAAATMEAVYIVISTALLGAVRCTAYPAALGRAVLSRPWVEPILQGPPLAAVASTMTGVAERCADAWRRIPKRIVP